jgi:hypothetical protein
MTQEEKEKKRKNSRTKKEAAAASLVAWWQSLRSPSALWRSEVDPEEPLVSRPWLFSFA